MVPSSRRLLLCGAVGHVGGRLAAAEEPHRGEVVGLGPGRAPAGWPGTARWIRGDATGAGIGEMFAARPPDVVVLFPWDDGRRRFPPRRRSLEVVSRVTGAVAKAGVPRLVLWSSTRVTEPVSPGRGPIPEGAEVAARPAAAGRDAAAVEGVVRGHLEGSGTGLVSLRAAHVVGSAAAAELSGLRELPVLPRIRGADPPLQFLHERDAVEILRRVLADVRPGTYNLAADGVVAWSTLCRAVRRPAARLPAPVWRVLLAIAWTVRLSPVPPTVVDLASRSWVVDNARLKTHIGYRPRLTCRQALSAWLGQRGQK